MLLDLINQRRSIRSYLNRPVPKEDLLKCIEAARLAPSACNAQPWRFIIVDDEQLKNKICAAAFTGMYAMNKFVAAAPALVIAIAEKEKFLSAAGGYLMGTSYYLLDVGIAGEHLILQATELGIGTCWIGWFNEKAVKAILKIPRNKKVVALISLGYEKGKPAGKSRKSCEEISAFNRYR